MRGHTLLELMIGLAASSIVLLGVAGVFIGVTGAYQREGQVKGAVEHARVALSYVERSLELAGYGVPPELAFDFGAPGAFPKDNHADAAADFVTDDLAFRFRDPGYLRRGQLTLGGTVSLSEPFGEAFRPAAPVLVACRGGKEWAMGNLPAGAGAGVTSAAVAITRTSPGTSASAACFSDTGDRAPYLFRLHERRIRIVNVGGRPYLAVFHALGTPDPALVDAWDPLAADAELFQVAYVMNRPTATSRCCAGTPAPDASTGGTWILGDAAEPLPNPLGTGPAYSDAYDAPVRFTGHAANVRGVRVSLVLRSVRQDRDGRSGRFERVQVENSPPPTAPADGFYRYLVQSTVRVPNLASRSFFLPPLRRAATDTELNVNGG